MTNIKTILLAIALLFNFSEANAQTFKFCKKWVADALAVTCSSHENRKMVGSLIFFKKTADDSWSYHATNPNTPFNIILTGPGLLGPHVTSQGLEACELFCEEHGGS